MLNLKTMSESNDSWRSAGEKAEKTMFSQTCNLLGEYLKEKDLIGELGLDTTSSLESSPDPCSCPVEPYHVVPSPAITLFPQLHLQNAAIPMNVQSMNLFPQQAGFTDSPSRQADSHMSTNSKSGRAQMTILYAGQVVVFDDFPADKAKEVMNLASIESSRASCASMNLATNLTEPTILLPASRLDVQDLLNNFSHERCIQTCQPISCGLLARKISLSRFLAKRKDRIQARAPYEVSTISSSDPFKSIENKSWLALAPQS